MHIGDTTKFAVLASKKFRFCIYVCNVVIDVHTSGLSIEYIHVIGQGVPLAYIDTGVARGPIWLPQCQYDLEACYIGTGVAISARGPIWPPQCQYNLEAHLSHILTFLLHPRKFIQLFCKLLRWIDSET